MYYQTRTSVPRSIAQADLTVVAKTSAFDKYQHGTSHGVHAQTSDTVT